jgi:chromosome segregation ATPase
MMDQVIIDLLNGGGEDLQRYENSHKSVAVASGKRAEPKRAFKSSVASTPLSYHDEVFIKDGEPTDDFLETMRRDLDLDFMNFESLEGNNDSKKEKTRASETPLRKNLDSKKRKMKTKLESGDLTPLKMADVSKSSKKTRPEETQISSAGVEKQNNFSDSNNILLEQQALIKSLQLRLVGALRTVKSLQASLKHANSQIDDQGSCITRLNSKLKLAADRAMQMKTATDDERHAEFLMKEIDELKKRLKVAEIRIDEESSEKARWEERCRNWRQCAEQAKQKLQVVESSVDIRVQTESKKNNKTSRRKVAERGAILYCDIAFRFFVCQFYYYLYCT